MTQHPLPLVSPKQTGWQPSRSSSPTSDRCCSTVIVNFCEDKRQNSVCFLVDNRISWIHISPAWNLAWWMDHSFQPTASFKRRGASAGIFSQIPSPSSGGTPTTNPSCRYRQRMADKRQHADPFGTLHHLQYLCIRCSSYGSRLERAGGCSRMVEMHAWQCRAMCGGVVAATVVAERGGRTHTHWVYQDTVVSSSSCTLQVGRESSRIFFVPSKTDFVLHWSVGRLDPYC